MTSTEEYDQLIKAVEQTLEALKEERKEALFTTPLKFQITETIYSHDGRKTQYGRPVAILCTHTKYRCSNYAETTRGADGNYYYSRDFPISLGYGPLCSYHAREAKFEW